MGLTEKKKTFSYARKAARYFLWVAAAGGVSALAILVFVVIQGKIILHTADNDTPLEQTTAIALDIVPESPQFPIGVNPKLKIITENPVVDSFFYTHVSSNSEELGSHGPWFTKILGKLALMSWYQNLASVSSRILVIDSGERREEVGEHFAKILGWNSEEKNYFLTTIAGTTPIMREGKFSPGTYTVARGAKPEDVIPLVQERFQTEVLSRYGEDIESVVPLHDTLTLASLLEREAYDFEDMRLISGVIWNRLFIDMRLQIDATLQYAKGGTSNQPWWPRVLPADKKIASTFNTYKYAGLPPDPIANPSLDAVLAALNPKQTDCMYYFHDAHAVFHCSLTYEEHVRLLKEYYGQGK